MSRRVELKVTRQETTENLDFGTLFHLAIDHLHSIGAYTENTRLGEPYLNGSINLIFCKTVRGSFYGYYPVYLPNGAISTPLGTESRCPFFHFSTLIEENWNQAKHVFSIGLDDDDQARKLLTDLYTVYRDQGYKVKMEYN